MLIYEAQPVWYISQELSVKFGLINAIYEGHVDIAWRTGRAISVSQQLVFHDKRAAEKTLMLLNS